MKELSQETIDDFIRAAKRKTWDDVMLEEENVYVDDFAGGNIDDAFQGGFDSGYTDAVRTILDALGIDYE